MPTVPPKPIIHRAMTRPRTFSWSSCLQGGVERGDEREVEGAGDGHVDVGRNRAAFEGEADQRERIADEADPDQQGLSTSKRRPCRWRWRQ